MHFLVLILKIALAAAAVIFVIQNGSGSLEVLLENLFVALIVLGLLFMALIVGVFSFLNRRNAYYDRPREDE